ncbi:MAG: GNAT family N-acetyltransferase [Rhodobacteraceae bacterium]|jgi:predicted GNAT superfamily acetyltransferase|nr:GNAT family N-acetyltransferase [Paracoccaceae bacterium]
MTDIVLRDLSSMAELRLAETLQRAVWGKGDLPDPADLMLVIQAEGGLVGGAFVEGRMLGYIFGFPTRDPRVQHSHRLAVLPRARGLGLGLRLKRYQRDWCLARGIATVRWTFDPLRALNATLNLHRLGATSATYLPDYYGEMAGINHGLASDRLLVDWELVAPQVAALAAGMPRPLVATEPLPVALPEDVGKLTLADPAGAAALRLQLRGAMQAALDRGRRIVDFDRKARVYLVAA